MLRDLHNNIKYTPLFEPKAAITDNTAAVSEIIDRANYPDLELVLITGTADDANATFTVLVEDGDDASLSDNAAVADSNLLGTEAEASYDYSDDFETRKIGYIGTKRYVRVTVTPAGNTGNFFLAGVAVQGGARVCPQS